MTRKKKCNSESNSFVAVAEQVCLQRVLEHQQRRGSNIIRSGMLINMASIICDKIYTDSDKISRQQIKSNVYFLDGRENKTVHFSPINE